MAKEDGEKTTFKVGQGLCQWRAMPMGLTSSPATFQQMMELVLQGSTLARLHGVPGTGCGQPGAGHALQQACSHKGAEAMVHF